MNERNKIMLVLRRCVAISLLTLLGACDADDSDPWELRKAAQGPGGGAAGVGEPEQEMDPEAEDEDGPTKKAGDPSTGIDCEGDPADRAAECSSTGFTVPCIGSADSEQGECTVILCDGDSGTLYECGGELIEYSGFEEHAVCEYPVPSLEDCDVVSVP